MRAERRRRRRRSPRSAARSATSRACRSSRRSGSSRSSRARDDVLFIHLTLLPYLRAAGEMKTKPTQQSVGKLREIGIQPDILICRTEKPMTERDARARSRCSATSRREAVIEEKDVDFSIYEVPLDAASSRGSTQLIVERLGLDPAAGRTSRDWRELLETHQAPRARGRDRRRRQVHRAARRLQVDLRVAQRTPASPTDARVQAAQGHRRGPRRPTARTRARGRRRRAGARRLRRARHRGQDRARSATRARTSIPFFGICLGMQAAVIEFARNVLRPRRTPTPRSTTRNARTR